MNETANVGMMGMFPMIITLALCLLMLASMWRIFTKAGQPGWAILIPIYNAYVMLKVAGKPGWWLLLMLIPVVNLIVTILMLAGIARTGYRLLQHLQRFSSEDVTLSRSTENRVPVGVFVESKKLTC